MSLTVANGPNGVRLTGTTLETFTFSASIGDMLVLLVAVDNAGTNGAAPGITSVTTTSGSGAVGSWSTTETNYDPGSASAGATLYIITGTVTTAFVSAQLTVTFSTTINQAASYGYKVTPGGGEAVEVITIGSGATGNLSSYSIVTSSITSGDTVIGAVAVETDDAITADADSTNGSWAGTLTNVDDTGADAVCMRIHAQYKTVTGTGTQTFNPTSATARDAAVNYIVLRGVSDTTDDLLANDVSSASSVTSPAITQTHVILANDVASASSVTAPALTQVHALLANDVASASSVGTPALLEVVPLLADDVASASSVSVPAIGQVHIITADDVASASSVGTPAVGQIHALLADDVASASSVSTPALAHIHVLTANDVSSASSVSTPALTEEAGDTVDDLLAEDVASASSVSTPALGQIHALAANDNASASSVSVPAFGQVHALTADDVTSASSVSAPALAEVGAGTDVLLADSVSSASSVSTPALTVIGGSITTAGRRSAATSYAYRTLGSLAREKKRELEKIARRANRKVEAALAEKPTEGLQALARREVTATAPKSIQWLSKAMLDGIVDSIIAYQRAAYERAQEQEDEEDAEVLLLAA
jgi:hypothetical protein